MLNEKVSEQKKKRCDKGGPHDKVALTAVTNYKLLPQQPQKTLICLSLFLARKHELREILGYFNKFYMKNLTQGLFNSFYPGYLNIQ